MKDCHSCINIISVILIGITFNQKTVFLREAIATFIQKHNANSLGPLCPASPEKEDPSTRELLRRADSTGPVSPICT